MRLFKIKVTMTRKNKSGKHTYTMFFVEFTELPNHDEAPILDADVKKGQLYTKFTDAELDAKKLSFMLPKSDVIEILPV